MNRQAYNFLTADQINEEDLKRLRKMLEDYFHTEEDPEQMQIGKDTRSNWIKNKIPECARTIKWQDEVVGSTLVLPATLALMQDFISGRINEEQLAAQIETENIAYANMQAIYICSLFVTTEHRGQHLTAKAVSQSIQDIMPKDKKLCLFYWAYSPAGKKIAEKVAVELGLEIFAREM